MSEEEDIIKVFNAWQAGVSAALTAQAEEIARLTAGTILDDMDTMKRTKYTKAFVDGVTDDITKDYKKYIKKGGSICVEPKYVKIAPGRVRATTGARFVPWLNDFKEEQVKSVLDLMADGQKAGVYPLDVAKQLEGYFEGTKHRAVTAARTEAQKIRTTARMDGYRKSNVKYVQYITAGDERVRPEHAMRDGKIYPLEKAPLLGEYNCRCILTEADFAVEELSLPVTENEAEIIDISEVEEKQKDTSGKETYHVEEIRPNYIRPLNDITNPKLYDDLVESMEEDGWIGDPIVVADLGGGEYQGLTGSHRVFAAKDAGLDDIPSVVIKHEVMDDEEWEYFLLNRDADSFASDVEKLIDDDGKDELNEALELLKKEVKKEWS